MNDIKKGLIIRAGERVKEERKRLGLSQAEAGSLFGVARETWGKYERGVFEIGGEVLRAFVAAGADADYIVTGIRKEVFDKIANEHMPEHHREPGKTGFLSVKEEKIIEAYRRGDEAKKNAILATSQASSLPAANLGDAFIGIPHYDIRAAAGYGVVNGVEEQLHPLAFRRDWLLNRHLSPTHLVVVSVKGESMEPRLIDNDLVLVDRSQTDITSGKTYVLRMDGHLLVKNLQLLPHGLVQVASFNPGFPPYQIDLSDESLDIAVIGRVVASMHEW